MLHTKFDELQSGNCNVQSVKKENAVIESAQ